MRFTIWSSIFLLAILTVPKNVGASSPTDEFIVELIYNKSLPTADTTDAFIVAAPGNKVCFAYRNQAQTNVIFGYGQAEQPEVTPIALASTELFTVAARSSGACLLFYTKTDAASFLVYALREGGTPSGGWKFNRSPDTTYTINVIVDPEGPEGNFILGFSFKEGISVKFGMIRYNDDLASDKFSDIDLDNQFMTDNPVKRLNFHQYGSENLTFMVQLEINPQVWWGKIQPTQPTNIFAIKSLPLSDVLGLTSQATSANNGVFCYNSVGRAACQCWNPNTSEFNATTFHSEDIDPGSKIALGILTGDNAVLFGTDSKLRAFAVQFADGQAVSRNELAELPDAQNLAASNLNARNRLFLLVRNGTGEVKLVQVQYDFCGNAIKNSREQCDGSDNCNQDCTLIDVPPLPFIPIADATPGRDTTTPNEQGGASTEEPLSVPASTLVPAIVIPVVVVAAGLLVLLLLLRRRKKRNGSLLHGKSRVEIAMDSIDDRLKIPYKSLVFKKEIGAGSYGKVYVGEWKGTPVAIKVSSSVTDMDGFFDEARITVGLQQHPNVVQTFGVSLDGQLPCIVLEFCEGSLDNRLFDSDVTMTPQQKVALIKGIARGLYHLHSNNIVHRDLAARNVLLNKSGTPKISDFGMSRVLKSEAEKGKTRTNYGPIRWMAPESLKDLQYSTKSDVWSFGIVLYEIVSRNEPHIDIDPLEVAVKIKNESYHPSIPQGVNPVLSEIMLSCWQSEPNNRPSMEQICNKLNSTFPED